MTEPGSNERPVFIRHADGSTLAIVMPAWDLSTLRESASGWAMAIPEPARWVAFDLLAGQTSSEPHHLESYTRAWVADMALAHAVAGLLLARGGLAELLVVAARTIVALETITPAVAGGLPAHELAARICADIAALTASNGRVVGEPQWRC